MTKKLENKGSDDPHLEEIEQLKQDYEARRASNRPWSHSVAVAYRKVIANCEREKSGKSAPQQP